MTNNSDKTRAGFGISFGLSAAIHVAVFLLLFCWGELFPVNITVKETYYVDVVNLPVSAPSAGNSAQQGSAPETVEPPKAPESTMKAPAKPNPTVDKNLKKPEKTDFAKENATSFAEKMAKLEKKAGEQQTAASIERLRKKMESGAGRSGMPNGTGKEQGSSYSDYIQSRLKDTFRETISYSSKNPEVVVRLFVDNNGKLSRQKVEKSSGDRQFEMAVSSAVSKAFEKIAPPPNGKIFEGLFIFKPQGISKNR